MRRALFEGALVLGLLAFGAGCSSGDDNAMATTGGPSPASYPDGPHGLEQGDILPNLQLTAPDGTPVSLGDYYQGEAGAVLLYVTATWCFTCGPEVSWLSGYQPRLDGDLVAFSVLLQNGQFEDASGDDAVAFGQEYGSEFPTLLDNSGQLDLFREEAFIPLNVLIDTDTMQITLRETGFDQAKLEQAIGSILDG